MNDDQDRIAAAYASLTARKLWRKPLAVYLTKSGRIIVGTAGAPIPESASLVCNYQPPLPSFEDFRGDIEHEAALLQAAQIPLPDQIVALLSKSRKVLHATDIARTVGARRTATADVCEALWRAGKIGRKYEKPLRGPMQVLWVSQTNKPSLRPVQLPTGPDAPARCAGRRPTPGAHTCPRREDCARYRALIDTWNDLSEAARFATPVHSQMCTSGSITHFMEITDAE